MADSPRAQHRSPVHGCGPPSAPCGSAAAEPGKPTGAPACAGSAARPGWVAGTAAGLAASWAQSRSLRPSCCTWALPRPSAGTGVQELLCGSAPALGQPREQALSKEPQMAACGRARPGSPWLTAGGRLSCWARTAPLGGSPQDPSARQGQAGAPGSAARTRAATGSGGWWPRCWPSFDSTRPGTWPRQAQVGHLPRPSLQIGALGARAAAVPVASHHAQLGPILSHGLSPHRDSCRPQHQRTRPSLAAWGCCSLPAPHALRPTRASSSTSPGSCPGPTARRHHAGPAWAPTGVRRG